MRDIAVVAHGGGGGVGGVDCFVVAAGRGVDGDRDILAALDIGLIGAHIRRGAAGAAVADRDGDDLAVGERDDERFAGDGVVDRDGVGDLAAFGDGRCSREADSGRINGVFDRDSGGIGGVDRFVVAAGGAGDGNRVGLAIVVDIVALDRKRGRDAGGVARGDGDGRAVGQRDRQVGLRGVGDRGGNRGGAAAFVDRDIVERDGGGHTGPLRANFCRRRCKRIAECPRLKPRCHNPTGCVLSHEHGTMRALAIVAACGWPRGCRVSDCGRVGACSNLRLRFGDFIAAFNT